MVRLPVALWIAVNEQAWLGFYFFQWNPKLKLLEYSTRPPPGQLNYRQSASPWVPPLNSIFSPVFATCPWKFLNISEWYSNLLCPRNHQNSLIQNTNLWQIQPSPWFLYLPPEWVYIWTCPRHQIGTLVCVGIGQIGSRSLFDGQILNF